MGRDPSEHPCRIHGLICAAALVMGAVAAAGQVPPKLNSLMELERWSEAESLAREEVAGIEAVHGRSAPELVPVLLELGACLVHQGRAGDEEPLEILQRAMNIAESELGRDHPDYAKSLTGMGTLHANRGSYDRGESLLVRAIAIQEGLPEARADLARALIRLGVVHWKTSRLEAAKAEIERALSIREDVYGPAHHTVAWGLSDYATVLIETGDYEDARRALERALAIFEGLEVPQESRRAIVLHNLGAMLRKLGNLEEARAFLEQALAVRERLLGPDHPEVAKSCNNLGNVLADLGDHRAARSYYERALAINEAQLGPSHPTVAMRHLNLGILLLEMGDVAAARRSLERAVEITEDKLPPDNLLRAQAVHNHGNALSYEQRYEEANRRVEAALSVYQAKLGEEHVLTGMAKLDLAKSLTQMGRSERALDLYRAGLLALENSVGEQHPLVASGLVGESEARQALGQLPEAETAARRAVEMNEAILGALHPATAGSYIRLAHVLAARSRPEEALDLALSAEGTMRNHIRLTARVLTEVQALKYAKAHAQGLDVAISLLASEGWPPARVWDAVVRSRALVLDELAHRHRTVTSRDDPATRRLAGELRDENERLAKLVVRGPGESDPTDYGTELVKVRKAREAAERALAEHSAEFRKSREIHDIGWAAVRDALPDRTALVAFVRYEALPADEGGGGAGPSLSEKRYLAFVQPVGGGEPVAVALGPASTVEDEIDALRNQTAGAGLLRGSRRVRPGDNVDAYHEAATAVRRAIWDPMEPHLRGADRVLIVPDGAVHLVSFGALTAEDRSYLVEGKRVLHYLSTERDVVGAPPVVTRGEGLLAVGGVDFEGAGPGGSMAVSTAAVSGADPGAQSMPVSLFRGGHSGCREFSELRFTSLPATKGETEALGDLWRSHAPDEPVVELDGAAASEDAVMLAAPGRRAIHLATHGFTLADDCGEGSRENPLLLSGLALAGANDRGDVGAGQQDGILTAQEIATLDLTGTDWVVLSACETGLGTIRTGEGVLGLRRAFEIAGARTLITSLWSVDDESTAGLMKELYAERLQRGMATDEALRAASLQVLEQRRAAGKSTPGLGPRQPSVGGASMRMATLVPGLFFSALLLLGLSWIGPAVAQSPVPPNLDPDWREDPERPRRFWSDAPTPEDYLASLAATGQGDRGAFLGSPYPDWQPKGPFGDYAFRNGRVANVRIHQIGDQDAVFAGLSSGGIWVNDTALGNAVWQPIGDGLPNPACKAFAVRPTDSSWIVVGTGDPARYIGAGFYYTSNGGATWEAGNFLFGGDIPSACYAMEFLDDNTVIVATTEGILRSTNAGVEWGLEKPGVATDLVVHPANPNIIYAVASGFSGRSIYRSTDGGDNFDILYVLPPLSGNEVGRGVLAICRDFPVNLAVMYYEVDGGTGAFDRMWIRRSTDGGASWINISPSQNSDFWNNQMKHAQAITFRPDDPNTIIAGVVDLAMTTNGGTTWLAGEAQNGIPRGHADFTSLKFLPETGNDVLWMCNDGGLYRHDFSSGITESWNGGAVTGLSGAQIDYLDARRDARGAGLQDNGVIESLNGGISWQYVQGGDGGDVEIYNAVTPSYFFVDGVHADPRPWRVWRKTGGQSPVEMNNPGNQYQPTLFYDRFANLLYATDHSDSIVSIPPSGNTWTVEVTGLERVRRQFGSYVDGKTIVANYWEEIEGNGETMTLCRFDGVNWDKTDVVLLPDNYGVVVTVYASTQWPGEFWAGLQSSPPYPKLYHTTDYWETVENISGVLASVDRVESIVVRPFRPSEIYVGTEIGMFWSQDGGATFEPFNDGLPIVRCTDLRYVIDPTLSGQDKLVVSTYGRGVWERAVSGLPIVFVDGNHAGLEDGTWQRPFNTVEEAVIAAPDPSIVAIRGTSYPENPPLELAMGKEIRFETYYATSVIGQ